jgi:hypothetical protein
MTRPKIAAIETTSRRSESRHRQRVGQQTARCVVGDAPVAGPPDAAQSVGRHWPDTAAIKGTGESGPPGIHRLATGRRGANLVRYLALLEGILCVSVAANRMCPYPQDDVFCLLETSDSKNA